MECPRHILSTLIKTVIEEIRKACKKDPVSYGFNSIDNAYEPLKLMHSVITKTSELCIRYYYDNSLFYSLPAPSKTYCPTSISATRNKRRTMEDRHVVIHDLNLLFDNQEASPSSYYAIFDGHAGHEAACYSAAHLFQYLAENKNFLNNPMRALKDAFCKTDACFLEKCRVEHFKGGTTAVVALLRPKEKALYIAWVGDSQALLVKQGTLRQCVDPHTPSREDEQERIKRDGGFVMHYGTWRVNGQLAVSRAIGDAVYKPYVTAIPDVVEIQLDGGEDFLIIASDGLWDHISEDTAAQEVYDYIAEFPEGIEHVSEELVRIASYRFESRDNISVIVVFLKDPHQITAEAQRWASKDGSGLTSSNMETGLDNANNPFTNSNGSLKSLDVDTTGNINLQKNTDGLLLNLTDNFKANGADLSPESFVPEKSNGTKKSTSDLHFEDDFGPETNVDAVDDCFSPVDKEKSFPEELTKGLQDMSISSLQSLEKSFIEEVANNNPVNDGFNPFLKQGDPVGEILADSRDETPTPPAEPVQDVGGLDVNPTESDSEDEWNYIKGGQEKPEKSLVVESSEEDDTMSQLNPNAAEFVPISPTRSIPSPSVCRPLLSDQLITQSPKRPARLEMSLPSETEFKDEVKSRPSDVIENGHESENEHNNSHESGGHDVLSGLRLDDISQFQPRNTPTNAPAEEFHFGPNAAPFTPRALDQSEAISTKANFGDETQNTFNMSFNDSELAMSIKEEVNSMSTSFYAEKGDPNLFLDDNDLNKVHQLPENIDSFIRGVEEYNKENNFLNGTYPIATLNEDSLLESGFAGNLIQTTDLDTLSESNENRDCNTDRDQQLISTPSDRTQSPVGLVQDDRQEEELTSSVKDDILSLDPLSPAKSHSSLVEVSVKEDEASESFDINTTEDEGAQPVVESEDTIQPLEHSPLELDSQLVLQHEQIAEPETSILQISEPEVASLVTSELENSRVQIPEPEESREQIPEPEVPASLQISEPEVSSVQISEPEVCAAQSAEPEGISALQMPEPEISVVTPSEEEASSVESSESEVQRVVNKEPSLLILEPEIPSGQVVEAEVSRVQIAEPEVPLSFHISEQEDSSVKISEPEISSLPILEPEVSREQISEPKDSPCMPEDSNVHGLAAEVAEVSSVELCEPEVPSCCEVHVSGVQISEPEVSGVQISEAEQPAANIVTPETDVVKEGTVEQAGAVPVLSTVPVATAVPQNKSGKKPSPAKKSIGKVEPTKTAPKIGAAKPLSKATTTSGTPRAGPAAKVPAKTGAISRPAGTTRTAAAAPASKPKTAVTKASARPTTRPTTEAPVTKTLSRPATAAPRTSPALSKTNASAPALSSRPAALFRAAPKPKAAAPSSSTTASTLDNKTNTGTARSNLLNKTMAPKAATAPPKPRTVTSAPPKPKVPATKTLAKSADLEKEKKDSANKLTASRSTTVTRTSPSTIKTASTLINKLEVKTSTTRTTSLTKTSSLKTSKTARKEQPKENGVAPTSVAAKVATDNCPSNNQLL